MNVNPGDLLHLRRPVWFYPDPTMPLVFGGKPYLEKGFNVMVIEKGVRESTGAEILFVLSHRGAGWIYLEAVT